MLDRETTTTPKSVVQNSTPLWKVGVVLWACSPAVLLLGFTLLYGTEWPYLRWVGFLGGIMNLYVLSAYLVQRKGIEDWYVRAIPITLGLLVANVVVFLLISFAIGLPVGMNVQR